MKLSLLGQQRAFDDVKTYLSSPLVMKAPIAGFPFHLYIVAEDGIIGVVLMQVTHHYVLKLVPHRR
jgi:hypothetical protein